MIFRSSIISMLLILRVTIFGSTGIAQEADPSPTPSSDTRAAAKLNGWLSDANPIWKNGELNSSVGEKSDHLFQVPPLVCFEQLRTGAKP